MKHTFYVYYDSVNQLFIKKYSYRSMWLPYSFPEAEREKIHKERLFKKTFTKNLGQARIFASAAVAKSVYGDFSNYNKMFGLNVKLIELSVEVE